MNHGSAVTWRRDGTVHPLTTIDQAAAVAINDFGTIAGTVIPGTGANHSFVLRDGHATEIAPPPGSVGFLASDINNRNQIVGHTETFVQGVVWQDGQFTILPTLGGGASAFSINDHGTIAGFAFAGLFPRAVIWTRLTN